MRAAGWSPSVRLFEAGACGAAILSDAWRGLDEIFTPGRDILLPEGPEAVLAVLERLDEAQRQALGRAARERILGAHTAAHRAGELDRWLGEVAARRLQAAPA